MPFSMPAPRLYSRTYLLWFFLLLLAVGLTLLLAGRMPNWSDLSAPTAPATVPVSYIPNMGQSATNVRYQVHGGSSSAFFTDEAILLAVTEGAETLPFVSLRWENANPSPDISAGRQLPGVVNYIRGNDPQQWRSDIPTYGEIVYHSLYPGVDLHYGSENGRLKGTYIVAPGSDPFQIRWQYDGAQRVSLTAQGDLEILLGDANRHTLTEAAPIAWQLAGQREIPVPVAYQLHADNGVSFLLPEGYDPNLPLILDPTLTFSTYLGGTLYDHGHAIAVDREGNRYLKGVTYSANFPTHNPLYPVLNGDSDVFIAKLKADSSGYEFITYLGGSSSEERLGQRGDITLDAAGNIYLTGHTDSADFPVYYALQPERGGPNGVAYVTALTPSGSSLLFSTYLGGGGGAIGEGIAIDWEGNIIVVGAGGSDFPLAYPLYQRPGGGKPFITKLTPDGQRFIFSTYLGDSCCGTGNSVAVDLAGDIYLTGETSADDFPVTPGAFQMQRAGSADVYVTKIKSDGSGLVYSTFVGGSQVDSAISIAVNGRSQAHVTGHTNSLNFPTANAFQPTYGGGRSDAFVFKLNESGSEMIYSTYLGGSADENFYGGDGAIVLDEEGEAYVVGSTDSDNFPTLDPIQPQRAGNNDLFIAKLDAGGQLLYSTYLGGANGDDDPYDLAVDVYETVHVVGGTNSTNFPMQNALQPQRSGSKDVYIVTVSHGSVQRPEIVPDILAFPSQAVHEASPPRSLVVYNPNESALTLSEIVIDGRHAANFAVTGEDCTADAIPPNDYCTVWVSFTPSGSGPRYGRVELSSPDWSGPRMVGLNGLGAASLEIAPLFIDFGFRSISDISAIRPISLSNVGDTPLPIGAIEVAGMDLTAFYFSGSQNNCQNQTIPAGETCEFYAVFRPSRTGLHTAVILIDSPFADEPARIPVQGYGGNSPMLTLTYEYEKEVTHLNSCAGLEVTVNGANFPVDAGQGWGTVALYWGDTLLETINVNADGTFAANLTVPANDGGVFTVKAHDLVLLSAEAEATIRTPRTNLPIILIPGVSGSELVAAADFAYISPPKPSHWIPFYDAVLLPFPQIYLQNDPIWLNLTSIANTMLGNSRYFDALRLEPDGRTPMTDVLGTSPNLVVGDILWQVEVPGVTTLDLYKGLHDYLLHKGYVDGQTLFAFPYDWRKNLDETSGDLNQLINHARAVSGQDQVVIVAHSMGGLVARNYMFYHGPDKVDQLITLGTPYLGAPKVSKILEIGDDWGIGAHVLNTLGVGAHPYQMREMARNYPSSYQLSPGSDWWNRRAWPNSSNYIVRGYIENFSLVRQELDYSASMFWLGRHNSKLASDARYWHGRRLGHLGDTMSSRYYNQRIIGVGNDTLGHLEFTPYQTCAKVSFPFGDRSVCLPLPEILFPKEDLMGDGTVPFHSALGAAVPLSDERYYFVSNTDHNSITSNGVALDYLGQMLRAELCSVRQLQSNVQIQNTAEAEKLTAALNSSLGGLELAEAVATAIAPPHAETLEITAVGTADLHIYDSAGNHVGLPAGALFGQEVEIPDASFVVSGLPSGGVQVARLHANDTYTITLTSRMPDGAASLRLTYYQGDQAVMMQVFQSIPMTTTTTATVLLPGLALGDQTPPLALVWAEGVPAVEIPLLGSYTGDEAENPDLIPPQASISVSESGLVTITAVDNPGGSGVATIFYSLDAAAANDSFVEYTGPFHLPDGPVKITAVALDNAGNGQYPGAVWERPGGQIYLPIIIR
jgi:pimeloyl-ACP methyl ester carboxylesterase